MCTFDWVIRIIRVGRIIWCLRRMRKSRKVKNRLNMMAANALEEVSPSKHIHGQSRSSYGFGVEPETSELRGVPTFPIPRRRSVMLDGSELGYKWASWIYAEIGGGIEITFLDPTGSGFFDFAPIPPNSPNHALWSRMAPETVVAQVVSHTPSIYVHDYGGDPLDLYMYTANFRASDRETAMEAYMGVPMAALTPSGDSHLMLDRDVVVYDRSLRPVFRDSVRMAEAISGQAEKGTLMVDQVRAALSPGQYLLGTQVRDPISRKVQVHKTYVAVSSFRGDGSGAERSGTGGGRLSRWASKRVSSKRGICGWCLCRLRFLRRGNRFIFITRFTI